MRKTFTILTLAVLILAAGTVAMYGQAPTIEKLASGTYIVYARAPQTWRFRVDPKTMGNVVISGNFAVTEGVPKNLDVLVFNEENYSKWKNEDDFEAKASAKPLASVIRLGEGNINAKLTDAGYYFLVISNRHQYEGRKTVNADIKVQYDKR